MARRIGRAVAGVVLVGSLLATGHLVWAVAGPASDAGRVAAQVTWLHRQLRDGAGARMQDLLPEGDFFTTVLTGIAAARTARELPEPDRGRLVEIAQDARDRIDTDAQRSVFRGVSDPPEGVFYRGWRLQLLVELAVTDGPGPGTDAAITAARQVADAVRTSPSAVLASYPGGWWPCDNVVALAALARTSRLPGVGAAGPDLAATARAGYDRLARHSDPSIGLLPHRTDGTGQALEGPRATSQSLVQAFLVDIDPEASTRSWPAYRSAFVSRTAGLLGVREYPPGVEGVGDVDSGPLVLGVSLSATVTTLAAAGAVGDADLWWSLDRQAEMAGLPWQWDGERRYAFGVLPVGDAFLAWARSYRPADGTRGSGERTWWLPWVVATATPGLTMAWVLWRTRRRRPAERSGVSGPWQPPRHADTG